MAIFVALVIIVNKAAVNQLNVLQEHIILYLVSLDVLIVLLATFAQPTVPITLLMHALLAFIVQMALDMQKSILVLLVRSIRFLCSPL